jgi:hypothetical protein
LWRPAPAYRPRRSRLPPSDELNDNRAPEEAKLFIYDVAAGKIVREIVPVAKARTTGLIKALPWPVSTDAYWPHWVDPSYEYESLTRGPDGFVWTYLKDVLVRIDPKDASVHVVGKIAPVGYPTFVGKDLYLSGPEPLRRIRNIVPARR